MSSQQDAGARRIIRIIVVAALTLIALALTLPDITLPWRPLPVYGFGLARDAAGWIAIADGKAVINVIHPGYSAAQAGLRVGDRVDLAAASPETRKKIIAIVYAAAATPGDPMTLPIERNGVVRQVTLTATPMHRSTAENVTDVILVLSQCLFVLIAAALVLVRPGMLTWMFFFFGLSTAQGSAVVFAHLSFWPGLVSDLWLNTWAAVGIAAFASFAMRFPSDRLMGRRRQIELVVFAVVAFIAVAGAYRLIPEYITGYAPTAVTAGDATPSASFVMSWESWGLY